jgi:hypothetical protein
MLSMTKDMRVANQYNALRTSYGEQFRGRTYSVRRAPATAQWSSQQRWKMFDYAEFLDRILWRRRPLRTGGSVHVVGAVHRDVVA